MIDVETDVFDEVARAVYGAFPEAFVSAEAVEMPARFPAVYVLETSNAALESREDSSGEENAVSLVYTVEVYDDSASGAKGRCKALLALADGAMRAMNMTRTFCRPLDNAADPSVYRITARYSGVVSKDKVHYSRR